MNILKNKVTSIKFENDFMKITINDIKVINVPYSYSEKLKSASLAQLKDYRFIANGVGIHWNSIDEDLSIEQIIKDFVIKEEQVSINIKLPKRVLNEVDKIAKTEHISRSQILKEAVSKYLNI